MFRGAWLGSTGGQVVVTENVHVVAAVFIPNSGSWGAEGFRGGSDGKESAYNAGDLG